MNKLLEKLLKNIFMLLVIHNEGYNNLFHKKLYIYIGILFDLTFFFSDSEYSWVEPVGLRTEHSLMELIWLVTQFWVHV